MRIKEAARRTGLTERTGQRDPPPGLRMDAAFSRRAAILRAGGLLYLTRPETGLMARLLGVRS